MENSPQTNLGEVARSVQKFPKEHNLEFPKRHDNDPDFLYAALDTTACAAFFKESRMGFRQRHRTQQEIRAEWASCAPAATVSSRIR